MEYKDSDGNVIIDYIRADMIYPLSWDNGDITECAFGTTRVVGGKERIYLQIHRFGRICDEDDGEDLENTDEYYIENRYVDAESGKEIDAPDGIVPKVATGYTKALFQIITTNICNNIDMDSPLGVSVYANSISQLKGCDLVYDSYMNEYILGRKRILVPILSAKMMIAEDGISTPVFDPNDTVYYQLTADRSNEMKLTEIDMKIRATDHELGIQRCLDTMSMKAGMFTWQKKSSIIDLQGNVLEFTSNKQEWFNNVLGGETMITPLEGRNIAGQKLIEKYGREYLTNNIKKLIFVEHVENGVLIVSFGIFDQDCDLYPSVKRDGGIFVEEKIFPSTLMSVSVDLKNGTANIIEE